MSERSVPYVGVSGVVGQGQQELLRFIAEREGLLEGRDRRILLLGVKATHKTQFLDTENKYGRQFYPVGEEFSEACSPARDSDDMLPVAQVFFDPDKVQDGNYRQDFSNRILTRGSAWLEGVQYDMLPWHKYDMRDYLDEVRHTFGKKVLLQVHGPAMEALGPSRAADTLARYGSSLDYVLFDASHGTGTQLDTHSLSRFLNEAYDTSELSHVGFGVAGGLDGDAVREQLPPLLRQFPDLSWDAEGKLHPVDKAGMRPLDIECADRYISASSDVIRDNQ